MDKLEAIKNKLRELDEKCKDYAYACQKCLHAYECTNLIAVSRPSNILKAIENIEKELK